MSEQTGTKKDREISAAIRLACKSSFGVLDSNFLCQSLGILKLQEPISVEENDSVRTVIGVLQKNKIGCVTVLGSKGELKGIFTERDCVLKVFDSGFDPDDTSVAQVMTADPVTATPDVTIAYALNLMSQGGFRHLPIVDESNITIGMVSVKDVIDHIVDSFTADLLQFETTL